MRTLSLQRQLKVANRHVADKITKDFVKIELDYFAYDVDSREFGASNPALPYISVRLDK